MSQEVSFEADFDGDMKTLLDGVRAGRNFRYNGRSMPIPSARVEGDRLLLPLPHRLVIIDLSQAIVETNRGNRVRVRSNFLK